jgi:glycerophosphoryl diester phosphodiesterase
MHSVKPLLIAHRAWPGGRDPENSLAALRAVLRGPVDGVEIDVRRSSDGGYVVRHDPSFPDGTPLVEMTSAAIRRRRLPNGEPVPTLEEFLAAAHRGLVFLDLKESCRPLEVADRALAVLPPERLFFSSFWHPGILELSKRRPGLRLGVTVEARLARPADALRAAGASVLVLPAACSDRATAVEVRRAGGEVWCWAVDDAPAARALVRQGVSGLVTDYPRRLAAR